MTLDNITFLHYAITVVGGVAIYLFTKTVDHEKRIQRVEDVYTRETERLIVSLDEVKRDLSQLTQYVHQKMHDDVNKQAYTEKLINLMYKKLMEEELPK